MRRYCLSGSRPAGAAYLDADIRRSPPSSAECQCPGRIRRGKPPAGRYAFHAANVTQADKAFGCPGCSIPTSIDDQRYPAPLFRSHRIAHYRRDRTTVHETGWRRTPHRRQRAMTGYPRERPDAPQPPKRHRPSCFPAQRSLPCPLPLRPAGIPAPTAHRPTRAASGDFGLHQCISVQISFSYRRRRVIEM